MTSLRALVRLAWRDARRDRWRTLLVIVLVTLPVAALGGAITLFDTVTASPEERAVDRMGRADAIVSPASGDGSDVTERLVAALPSSATVETITTGGDHLVVPGERIAVSVTDAPIEGDALGVGRYRLLEGRVAAPGEVVLTRPLAASLEVDVGDRLDLAVLGDVEVVGLAHRKEGLDERSVLVPAGSLAREGGIDIGYRERLVTLPAGERESTLTELASTMDAEGVPHWYVLTRDEVAAMRFTGGERAVAVIAGGLAAVEVALIVGAAFAVSVRRRQRELGLLAAVGGATTHVRRVVLLTGGVAGVLGAVLGTGLGLAGVVAASPWLEAFAGREVAGLRIDPLWLAGVAVLGIASTLVGAWWPARTVANLPVVVALSGRRPAPHPSVRGLRAGLATVAAGVVVLVAAVTVRAASPFVFLLGSVLLVLGVGLASPWLLERLGGLAGRLPVGPRLAVRDAARFRTRNGPILTAAMAGLAASVTITTVVTSMEVTEAANYRPSLEPDLLVVRGDGAAGVADTIAAELGGEVVMYRPTDLEVVAAADPGMPAAWLGTPAVGTPALARFLAGHEGEAALARGEVVLLGSDHDRVLVRRWEVAESSVMGDRAVASEPEIVPIGEYPAVGRPLAGDVDPAFFQGPAALVPAEVAADAELSEVVALVRLTHPADEAAHELAVRIAGDAPGQAFVQTELGYRSPFAMVNLVVLLLGGVTGLVLVGVAIALAATEARGDLRTLRAVGADRRTRRGLAAGRALLLSGLGGVLAVPVGLVPGLAIVARTGGIDPAVPWAGIAMVAALVPLLATTAAALAASRDPGVALRTAA